MDREKGLHFTDVGAGEVALVFLHYFGGSSKTWNKVIAELSHQFRCIAIDLPGFGESQGEIEKLSVSQCALEVAHVLKSLSLKHYVLVGHSMGGKIALSLASIQPTGLEALILIAPSPPTPEPMEDKDRNQLLNAYGNRNALITLVNNITAEPLPQTDIDNVIADNLKVSLNSWNWWVQFGSREDISSHMLTMRVKVFVISGTYDSPLSTAFLLRELSKYFPSALFSEVADAAHLIPIEAPLEIAFLIRDFLNA